MKPYRIAFAAAVCLAPMAGNATTYRLDAVVGGLSQDFGSISIDPTVVRAAGGLNLTRSCPEFGPCSQGGPWDQVMFDLTGNLEAGVTGTGPGAVSNISLQFAANGDVTGGSILVEAPEGSPGVAFLRASLNSGPGPCTGTELCGTYIPVELANPMPVSIRIIQQSATLTQPVAEPPIGLPIFLAMFAGIMSGARVLRL